MAATVADLVAAMEAIAPPSAAEPWDKVGLHMGRQGRALSGPVLLTIDLTRPVLEEAIAMRASAVVSYHPPIWEPMRRVTDLDAGEAIVLGLLEAQIAVYSPHTALDAAAGGITDWLCEGVAGLAPGEQAGGRINGDKRALKAERVLRESQQVKIVTFVPEGDLQKVRAALATAGAGRIGLYEVCSFSSEGTGTFLAGEGASPAVGEVGRLESAAEHRLEMVCSRAGLPLAVETLRQFHPYEEPAFDIYDLHPEPRRTVGAGRKLVLDQPHTLAEIGERLRTHLGLHTGQSRVKVACPAGEDDLERPVQTIGIVPGSGAGELSDLALSQGCELFITGEARHHEVLALQHRGCAVMLAGHTNTERGYLPRLASRLGSSLRGVTVHISGADRDPLRVVP